jgi:hypothetical protein
MPKASEIKKNQPVEYDGGVAASMSSVVRPPPMSGDS